MNTPALHPARVAFRAGGTFQATMTAAEHATMIASQQDQGKETSSDDTTLQP